MGFLFALSLTAIALAIFYHVWLTQRQLTQQKLQDSSGISTRSLLYDNLPIRKDGVVFISDGAKGVVREAAIELSKHGYHVLVGVKSEAELRSFAFDMRKGLEIILFDITSPPTFVDLIYRIRQLKRDLDRPLVGVVLNLAEYIEDYTGIENEEFLNINYLDRHYKALFKGPVRLLQSFFDLIQHNQNAEQLRQQQQVDSTPRLADSSESSEKEEEEKGKGRSTAAAAAAAAAGGSALLEGLYNAQGLRITSVYSIPPIEAAGEFLGSGGELMSYCGAKCEIQYAFLNYLDSFANTPSIYSNFSISQIGLPMGVKKFPRRRKGKKGKKRDKTPDVTSPKGEKEYELSVLSQRMRAIKAYTHEKVQWVQEVATTTAAEVLGTSGSGSASGGVDKTTGLPLTETAGVGTKTTAIGDSTSKSSSSGGDWEEEIETIEDLQAEQLNPTERIGSNSADTINPSSSSKQQAAAAVSSVPVKALMHSFLSSRPHKQYHCNNS